MRLVVAPVPGMIRKVFVSPQESVTRGQILFELDVFGMTQRIVAPVNGAVRLLLVKNGEQVRQRTLLAELDEI